MPENEWAVDLIVSYSSNSFYILFAWLLITYTFDILIPIWTKRDAWYMFIKRHVLVTCQKRWDYKACLVICNHMWLKHYRATRGHKKWFCHQTAAEARITKAVGSKCTLIRVVLISMLWIFLGTWSRRGCILHASSHVWFCSSISTRWSGDRSS